MSSDEGLHNAHRLATLLSGGIRGGGYYPPGHPASRQPFIEMAQLASLLHREEGEIRVAVVDGVLAVGEHLFFAPTPPLQELCRRLEEKELLGINIKKGVSADDLTVLAKLLGQPGGGAEQLREGLKEASVATIEVREEETLSQTYAEAVGAIAEIFNEIGNGRIPNSRKMITVVTSLAATAVKEPATLIGLTMIKQYDNYTFQHSVNVGVLAMAISASMGLSPHEVEVAGMAGFLHDVGKTGINKMILNKPGKLSNEEFREMQRHSELGAEIVRQMEGVPEQVAEGVLGHHVRHDRTGYPEWARPLPLGVASAIVAVADCYDATTTLRAYQPPLAPKQAVERIRSMTGTGLDPEIVDRFLELTGKFPTGSLVRLDSNEIAVVMTPSREERGASVVKVLIDSDGKPLADPLVKNLALTGESVVDLVDPLLKGIDVSAYF
ncbi:HD-GYP domain-containing protein [Geomonas sp. Red32]|uniref:HD-GYP domain-containing protein n=1 Tax=Geomonas sp. Red32 TaxID=2912856 RepID=UPI00202CB80E|nr:HD-GYP domain-containing protein [Geomonas sp. Red32]MCM0080705.1 HD-GYP domain-containing protein [Geomonas sp. Red32]